MNATQTLIWQCQVAKLPAPEAEYLFAASIRRRWRFDLAWPAAKVALEINGGAFTQGRHTRGAGFRADCEKLAVAAGLGWRVIPCLPEHVTSGAALTWIEMALGAAVPA